MSFTKEQLEQRRQGIGASEVSAIVGLSPFRTAHDIYLEKIGAVDPTPETLPQKRGRILESALRDWFCEDTGLKVWVPQSMKHDTEPFYATPDGIILREGDGPSALLELKSDFSFQNHWGEEEDAVPDWYAVQVAFQLGVTGFDLAYLAVLRLGNFRIYTLRRDQDIIDTLFAACREFWTLVQNRTPPRLDASDSSRNLLRSLFPENNGIILKATPQADA